MTGPLSSPWTLEESLWGPAKAPPSPVGNRSLREGLRGDWWCANVASLFQGVFYDQNCALWKWTSQVPHLGHCWSGTGKDTLLLASWGNAAKQHWFLCIWQDLVTSDRNPASNELSTKGNMLFRHEEREGAESHPCQCAVKAARLYSIFFACWPWNWLLFRLTPWLSSPPNRATRPRQGAPPLPGLSCVLRGCGAPAGGARECTCPRRWLCSVPPELHGLGAGQALFPEVWVPILGNGGMGPGLPGTMDDGSLIPVVVQRLSCVQLFVIPPALQHSRLPCPSLSPPIPYS